ncbi:MAG: NAD(P)H-dependent oxidoreductase [Anaerolineae bacterium]|nr:NAD(P)H-dependent oxidoreductase [Anaerolineae bacterium]
MNAVILDGSSVHDPMGPRVRSALQSELEASGWEVRHVLLRDQKIGNCAGDFLCWVRNPGQCNVQDDNLMIAAAIANSDLLVYLTPVVFGGYSSQLKRMVDHQIQNISPFFASVEGETHHQKRYDRYPDFLAIGWMDRLDDLEMGVFHHLVQRNRLNFYPKTAVSDIVPTTLDDAGLRSAAQRWVKAIQTGASSPDVSLPVILPSISLVEAPKRAVLLVGSPRTQKSVSNALGGFVMEELATGGVETQVVQLYTTLRSGERWQAVLDALDAADLVVLAFPLYVDTLPAPVIEALERIATHRQQGTANHRPRFTAIINNGFPEVTHSENALSVCGLFAKAAGMDWVGGFILGGGGMLDGSPLRQAGGPAVPVRMALEKRAAILVKGEAFSTTQVSLLEKPVIPAWLYRTYGDIGWRVAARRYKVHKHLRRKPYLEKTP